MSQRMLRRKVVAAVVLLVVVLLANATAIVLRNRFEKKR